MNKLAKLRVHKAIEGLMNKLAKWRVYKAIDGVMNKLASDEFINQ